MSFAEIYLGKAAVSGFTEEMLNRFLTLSIEEGLNLDYKSIESAQNPDKLAIIATAFANAEGGLVVLGVEERREEPEQGGSVRIRPGRITWGPSSLSREKIESVLVARIHPWIQGLRIFPIRNEKQEAVFLIDVPQSLNPPHQGPDGKYYLRYNFQNLPMNHHQVEDLFFRRQRPDIRPHLDLLEFKRDESKTRIRIGLANEGSVIGKQVLFFGDFMNCMKVEDQERKWFLSVEPYAGKENRYLVSYQSPILVIHPTMINYPGKVDVTLASGPLLISITIGAEDSKTRQFWSGISPNYLLGLDHDFAKGPFPLVVVSLEEFEKEKYNRMLRQIGVDPEEFERLLKLMATAPDSEAILKAAEDLVKLIGGSWLPDKP